LVALDFSLKVILVFFVLGTECDGLVDLLFGQLAIEERSTILS